MSCWELMLFDRVELNWRNWAEGCESAAQGRTSFEKRRYQEYPLLLNSRRKGKRKKKRRREKREGKDRYGQMVWGWRRPSQVNEPTYLLIQLLLPHQKPRSEGLSSCSSFVLTSPLAQGSGSERIFWDILAWVRLIESGVGPWQKSTCPSRSSLRLNCGFDNSYTTNEYDIKGFLQNQHQKITLWMSS